MPTTAILKLDKSNTKSTAQSPFFWCNASLYVTSADPQFLMEFDDGSLIHLSEGKSVNFMLLRNRSHNKLKQSTDNNINSNLKQKPCCVTEKFAYVRSPEVVSKGVHVNLSNNMKTLSCWAPARNSTGWIKASISFEKGIILVLPKSVNE